MKQRKILKKENTVYFLSLGLPVLLLLGIFIYRGIYPFGENSFMYSDMYHQYVPFLTEFWEKLHSGESLAYTFRIGLGTNFTAVYAYYLASPVYWLCYFVPKAFLVDYMTYLIVLKIGLCGFTMSYYLTKHFDTKDIRITYFAIFYAMSGYVAAYNWNHMWLDCLLLAPIVILGLEELVRSHRCRRYILSLTAGIFTNYYLSIILCVFLVLYFLMELFTNGLKFKDKCKSALHFTVSSLLAGAMAGVLLVPLFFAMQTTGFHDFSFPKKIEVYFDGLSMIARHVPMLQPERGLDHWPNIYCGVCVFLLVPMYIWHKKISPKKKIGYIILLTVFLLSYSVNLLNYIWHGFNYPNSLPARQSFLYILVILTMCCEVVLKQKENGRWQTAAGILTGLALLAACGIFVTTDGLTVEVMASAWIFLAGYLLLSIVFAIFYQKKGWKKIANWAILLLVCTEAVLNMAYTSVEPVGRNYYLGRQKEYESIVAMIEEADPGQSFYRMDNLDQMTKNDGALSGFSSLSVFSSTTNSHIRWIYDKLGMGGSKVTYHYKGATPFAESILGLRYLLMDVEEPDTFLYTKIGETEDFYVCRQNYSLGPGFFLTEKEFDRWNTILTESNSSAFAIQNALVRELGVEQSLFKVVDEEITEQKEDSFTVDVQEDGYLYALVYAEPEGKIFLSSKGEERELQKVSDEYLLRLGYFEKGDSFTVHSEDTALEEDNALKEVTALKKGGEKIWIRPYRMQKEVFEDVMDILSARKFTVESRTADTISGSVTAEENGYICFSIPAEQGFQVWVDGEKTDYALLADGLLAVPLTGDTGDNGDMQDVKNIHEIRLVYKAPGIKAGLCLSVAGVLLYIFIYGRNSEKKKGKEK